MKCRAIIEQLNLLAPEAMACGWDNPGLLAGRWEKEVKKIYLALDATDAAVHGAAAAGADMLITHHPLIFKAIKKVNDGDFIGRRLVALLQADISYYAMHTNFDSAPGCMADMAAEKLGLQDCQVLEAEGEMDGAVYGIGKIGMLESPMGLKELAELVKERFGLASVTVYGDLEEGKTLSRCAVSPGSGGSMTEISLAKGAQVLITGDIGHHEGIDSVARGMAVIDAGHYGLEYGFVEFMEEYLHKTLTGEVEIIKEETRFPSVVV